MGQIGNNFEDSHKHKCSLWIVFEGIDGCGKTTQAEMLNNYLNNVGIKCLYTHVFDTEGGRCIRKLFIEDDELNNATEILLLCTARQLYLDKLVSWMENYDVIITDRFFDSIYSMQGKNLSSIDLIATIEKAIMKNQPEYVQYYIDVPPEVCNMRMQLRGLPDRVEKKGVSFHRKVYERFKMQITQRKECYVIDGNRTEEAVFHDIVQLTKRIFSI